MFQRRGRVLIKLLDNTPSQNDDPLPAVESCPDNDSILLNEEPDSAGQGSHQARKERLFQVYTS